MNLYLLAEISMAVVPVLCLLGCLMLLDSFKLVGVPVLLATLLAGLLAAVTALAAHQQLMQWIGMEARTFSRFIAPFTEELLKVLFIVYLVRAKKIGFMVDAAILGFAAGTGFAIIENIYYMHAVPEAGLLVWVVRGLGTSVMHGGAAAAGAIIIKQMSETGRLPSSLVWIPGYAAAALLHMFYNQFFLPPLTLTLLILISVPLIVMAVFKLGEWRMREWLGSGLDNDIEILRMILEGNLSQSRIGRYMQSLRRQFPDVVMADLICYLRLYLELSVRAKGMLILHESGLSLRPDPELRSRLDELMHLEKNIGKTGKLALQPLLNLRDRDMWQLYKLQKGYG